MMKTLATAAVALTAFGTAAAQEAAPAAACKALAVADLEYAIAGVIALTDAENTQDVAENRQALAQFPTMIQTAVQEEDTATIQTLQNDEDFTRWMQVRQQRLQALGGQQCEPFSDAERQEVIQTAFAE